MIDPDPPSSVRQLGARELAGYRVLRSLASDQHAEVLLGHRITDDVVQTVAIKVSPASGPGWDAALRACAALDRARGDHVVRLIDVDADDESIRLIYARLPRGDLADLLKIRRVLDAGEAVTILAPIAATLLRLHRAGVAHGQVSGQTVLFSEDGSPTLIGFSRAELFEPDAPEVVLERVGAVGRDRAATRSLALEVLGRVEGSRAHATRELMSDLEGCADEVVLPLLTSRLFEVAAARPVRFAADEEAAEIAPSNWRAIPVGDPRGTDVADAEGGSPSGWSAALARMVPDPLLERVLETVTRSAASPVVAGVVAVARRHWSAWTSGRRRVVLAVAAAAVTIGIITAVVPAGASAPTATSRTGPSASAPLLPRSSSQAAVSDEPEVDDPAVAAVSLVGIRERCLNSLSLRCLDGVDETGSRALDDDQAAIRRAQQGGELPDPSAAASGDGPPTLIERLGDSALVRLGSAASSPSLLLVKVDGVWRIRDVVDASAAPTAGRDAAGG